MASDIWPASYPIEKIASSGKVSVCQYCMKEFGHKRSYKRHLKIHFGERPYACDHCGYRATEKHHLQKHLARKHNIDMNLSMLKD